MDEKEFKKALDTAELMGFDRGVKTIFVQLLKTMEDDKMRYVSYDSIKKLYSELLDQIEKTKDKMCCGKCDGFFAHRVGSHSDDRGGDSDNPCYCNAGKCDNKECDCHK